MAARSIFSPDHHDFIAKAYLQHSKQPAEVTELLNKRFETTFSVVQVQRHINIGLSKRRKAVKEKRTTIERKTDAQIARESARENQRVLGAFADKSKRVTDKALDMALSADNPRSLNAATSAAKAALTMFRVCAGLEGSEGAGPRGAVFNFNFSAFRPPTEGQQPTVEVLVSEADDDDVVNLEDEDAEQPETKAPEQAAPTPPRITNPDTTLPSQHVTSVV